MKIPGHIQKVIKGVLMVLLIGGAMVLLAFVSNSQEALLCKNVQVRIDNVNGHDFIEKQEVLDLIHYYGKIKGKPVGSINTSLLEKRIISNPFVKRAEVYSAIDGTLHADLVQRNPIVRIVNMSDEHFYIDNEGVFMPLSDRYTPPVLVANGYIFNRFSEGKVHYSFNSGDSSGRVVPRIVEQIFTVARAVEADTFWSVNTEQIYVNEFQELELIPRVGSYRILIGDTTALQEKLNRLLVFYKEGLPKTGWNNYKLINLKFKDQVVCTKIK